MSQNKSVKTTKKNWFGYRYGDFGGCTTFSLMSTIAPERGCGRLEWSCLDWNTPSIDFYISLGAKQMNEWTVYRFEGESLAALAERK